MWLTPVVTFYFIQRSHHHCNSRWKTPPQKWCNCWAGLIPAVSSIIYHFLLFRKVLSARYYVMDFWKQTCILICKESEFGHLSANLKQWEPTETRQRHSKQQATMGKAVVEMLDHFHYWSHGKSPRTRRSIIWKELVLFISGGGNNIISCIYLTCTVCSLRRGRRCWAYLED